MDGTDYCLHFSSLAPPQVSPCCNNLHRQRLQYVEVPVAMLPHIITSPALAADSCRDTPSSTWLGLQQSFTPWRHLCLTELFCAADPYTDALSSTTLCLSSYLSKPQHHQHWLQRQPQAVHCSSPPPSFGANCVSPRTVMCCRPLHRQHQAVHNSANSDLRAAGPGGRCLCDKVQ